VWQDGSRTRWAFVTFEQPLTYGEDAVGLRKSEVTQCLEMCPIMVFDGIRREWPTQWHRCVPKRTESWLCWTIKREQMGSQIAILSWFFIRLNQLNISTQGKSKIFSDVSTVQDIVAFNGKIQLWIYRIESGKVAAFLALNAFAEEIEIGMCCTRQIFLELLTTSLRVR